MTSRMTPNIGSGRIMATDGGNHPASLWAQVVVDDICSLGPNLDPAQQSAALRMQADMLEAITPYFDKYLERERDQLESDFSRMVAGIDPVPHVDELLKAIIKTSARTRWEPLFNESSNVMALKQLLSQHIASLIHGERSWHADRNPDSEHALALRAAHAPMSDYVLTDEDRARAMAENIKNGG